VWEAVRTDVMMREPNLRVADAQAEHQPDTFVYRFDWEAPGRGAVHAVDIPFTFGTFDREGWGEAVGHDARAEQLGIAMRAAWTAFAHTADPGWPRYASRTRQVVLLGPELRVEGDPEHHAKILGARG
jgi:carboxylesterase type B